MDQDRTPWWRRRPARAGLIGAALVLLVAALYWPVRSHDFINYDDDLQVSQNAIVRQGLTLAGRRLAVC